MRGLIQKLLGPKAPTRGKIAIGTKPKSGPWGGGNQFIEMFSAYARSQGFEICYSLERDVSGILMIEPRKLETTKFDPREIAEFKKAHPEIKVVHRINECDQRKNTAFMDEVLREANAVADETVFISHWLMDYFVERWFDPRKPHAVIQNGADPAIFHPDMNREYRGGVFKLVTHHWSDNWMKGFRVYEEVDRLIAEGALEGFSLTVIGRWPAEINWRAAKLVRATKGQELAELLRSHDAYLTASLWEPCGMHHIEGAQCGLPLIYHEDGGGIVEYGERYGIGFRNDVRRAIIDTREEYPRLRRKVLESMPSGLAMCKSYLALFPPRGEAR